VLGVTGYPARPEEIRREGWHARRVSRTRPPSPLSKTFIQTVDPRIQTLEKPEMNREGEFGMNPKRGFDEDQRGGRYQEDGERGSRRG